MDSDGGISMASTGGINLSSSSGISIRNFYSDNEKRLVKELVHKYRDILDCKRADWRSLKRKGHTWNLLTDEFNMHPGVMKREAKSLKKCWENMKARSKLAMAKKRREKVMMLCGYQPTITVPALCETRIPTVTTNEISSQFGKSIKAEPPDFTEDERSVSSHHNSDENSNDNKATTQESSPTAATTNQYLTQSPEEAASYYTSETPGVPDIIYGPSSPAIPTTQYRQPVSEQEPARTRFPTESQLPKKSEHFHCAEEHYLQVKLLRQKLDYAKKEHEAKMQLLQIQQQFWSVQCNMLLQNGQVLPQNRILH